MLKQQDKEMAKTLITNFFILLSIILFQSAKVH